MNAAFVSVNLCRVYSIEYKDSSSSSSSSVARKNRGVRLVVIMSIRCRRCAAALSVHITHCVKSLTRYPVAAAVLRATRSTRRPRCSKCAGVSRSLTHKRASESKAALLKTKVRCDALPLSPFDQS
jgi:hypothetical protein